MSETWVVVAESSRARIFSMKKNQSPLQEITDMTHLESRVHGQELSSDRPGRAFDSRGGGRHAMETEVDLKRQEAINFAKTIIKYIESGRTQGHFEKLILIAPPEFLGLLRKNLSESTRQQIVKEISKNIVQQDKVSIYKHITD